MENLYWSNDLATGVHEIDSQHKKLFNYLNILIQAENNQESRHKTVQTTLDGLIEYTEIHFEEEEIEMEKRGYPDLERHKKLHRDFASQAQNLKRLFDKGEDLLPGLISFVQEWLVKHIKQEDMKALRYKA